MKTNTTFTGIALAAILASSPMIAAAEILFDNGSAVNNTGSIGGRGFSTNEMTSWQVYENFSLAQQSSIEFVWFQMAGGTEPFVFAVYADDDGRPGAEIYSTPLNAGDYSFDNFTIYVNGPTIQDFGHDFSFTLPTPLTLEPGDYWLSFWGVDSNLFYTLGTRTDGGGDGFFHQNLNSFEFTEITRGDTPFRLEGEPVDEQQVTIDIRPGSDENPVNPRSNGVIPVAVLTTADFDATTIDSDSVTFGPGNATLAHRQGHVEDVDEDGMMDMVFHFRTQQTGIACGDTEATLSGEDTDGNAFSGTDSITPVGCGNTDVDEATEDDGDDSGGGGGSDAAAADWTILLTLGILGLVGFQRRRAPNR